MASSANDYAQIYKDIQKIASDSQVKIQQLTNESTAKSFEYNAKEAEKTRTWEKSMSDTSHQREVKDLIKAGLNPVLSANQGANAYSTTSAHAQAENASQAIASLQGQRIGSMASVTGSKMGADATRSAAQANASAMRAAAITSANAQKYYADAARYSANMNYAAQVYKADKDFEISQYKIEHEAQHTVVGVLSQFANNTGIPQSIAKAMGSVWKPIDEAFYTGLKGLNKLDINLSEKAQRLLQTRDIFQAVNRSLSLMDLKKSDAMRILFLKAFAFKNPTSLATLKGIYNVRFNRNGFKNANMVRW